MDKDSVYTVSVSGKTTKDLDFKIPVTFTLKAGVILDKRKLNDLIVQAIQALGINCVPNTIEITDEVKTPIDFSIGFGNEIQLPNEVQSSKGIQSSKEVQSSKDVKRRNRVPNASDTGPSRDTKPKHHLKKVDEESKMQPKKQPKRQVRDQHPKKKAVQEDHKKKYTIQMSSMEEVANVDLNSDSNYIVVSREGDNCGRPPLALLPTSAKNSFKDWQSMKPLRKGKEEERSVSFDSKITSVFGAPVTDWGAASSSDNGCNEETITLSEDEVAPSASRQKLPRRNQNRKMRQVEKHVVEDDVTKAPQKELQSRDVKEEGFETDGEGLATDSKGIVSQPRKKRTRGRNKKKKTLMSAQTSGEQVAGEETSNC